MTGTTDLAKGAENEYHLRDVVVQGLTSQYLETQRVHPFNQGGRCSIVDPSYAACVSW